MIHTVLIPSSNQATSPTNWKLNNMKLFLKCKKKEYLWVRVEAVSCSIGIFPLFLRWLIFVWIRYSLTNLDSIECIMHAVKIFSFWNDEIVSFPIKLFKISAIIELPWRLSVFIVCQRSISNVFNSSFIQCKFNAIKFRKEEEQKKSAEIISDEISHFNRMHHRCEHEHKHNMRNSKWIAWFVCGVGLAWIDLNRLESTWFESDRLYSIAININTEKGKIINWALGCLTISLLLIARSHSWMRFFFFTFHFMTGIFGHHMIDQTHNGITPSEQIE